LKSYNDGTTSATYDYDDVYRKLSETVNYGPFQKSYAYEYFKNGMKKAFTGPDNTSYTYSYDADNQLTAIQIPSQGAITYTSYNWMRPTSITLPGGSKKDYVYDPLMRIKQITVKDPAENVLMNYQYAYNKMDNVMSKQTAHGNYSYAYDALYRLTNETNPINGTSFTYDPVGNRITSSDITGNWSYNQNNELQGYDDVTYEYDANGNAIKKINGGSITNYGYEAENRLSQVQDGTGNVIASYYYDPFGRRLWKEVGANRTYFLYADAGLVGECDATGAIKKTYGYAPDSNRSTDPIFMRENDSYYFYHNDHLGTPQKITSVNGEVIWSATYTAFGEATLDPASTIINNLRAPGQYYDEETGLYYNNQRYYDPTVGRYITADPIGLEGGINLFTYCLNNPINLIDPLGGIFEGFEDYLKERTMEQLAEGHHVAAFIDVLGLSALCFSKCMAWPGLIIHEAVAVGTPGAATGLAKSYYHFTDKRVTAWGKFSKVLIPKLSKRLTRYIPLVGWGIAAYEAYKCIKECREYVTSPPCKNKNG
jgi:RHS repeat-associated protein